MGQSDVGGLDPGQPKVQTKTEELGNSSSHPLQEVVAVLLVVLVLEVPELEVELFDAHAEGP